MFIGIVTFGRERYWYLGHLFLMCLVSDSGDTHKRKIQVFRAQCCNAHCQLLPEPDVYKKEQNHLLSIAIKAKFTFCFNRFYFAL